MDEEVLRIISDEDLPKLREFYSKYLPYSSHVCSLLNTCMKWKEIKPRENYVTFYSVDGDWRKDGTFILLMQYGCYDLFVFTMEKSCANLYRGLTETKLIDWSRRMIIYAVVDNHVPTMFKALSMLQLPIDHWTVTLRWCIPKEKALKFEITCPEGVYLDKLNVSHAPLVNSLWPHRYEGSVKYIETFIEMNQGHGLFLKSDGSLVAWVLKNHMGQLGILQTVEEHKRKGYATLITKSLAKEIAEEGHNPLGTVVKGNVPSESLFRNLGFEVIDACTFIEIY